ncbi:MAG: hypothetical protein ACRD23_05455 [Terriglobales bacterium]
MADGPPVHTGALGIVSLPKPYDAYPLEMKGTRPDHLDSGCSDCLGDEDACLRETPEEEDDEENEPDNENEGDEDDDDEGYSE